MSQYISDSGSDDGDADFTVNTQNDSKNLDATAVFEPPIYVIQDWSGEEPLTRLNISKGIRANYWRGRSMLYEIARKERRWTSFVFRNKDTRIKLLGPALKLDHALHDMMYDCGMGGEVGADICEWHCIAHESSKAEEEGVQKKRMMTELVLNDSEIIAFEGKLLISQGRECDPLGTGQAAS
ncbi:hypothetical protein BOTCAL_0284g00150 [Botryotinia calthae]|uniref:Uncharacterized protein n=1 Tax=Botryotinia calthae TaxID=38488 RepID=A0A4Y8CW07_9HELO|nr:hypothetical protein BOTCAL_0284g00150 [Botryotinia calthae]